MTTQYDGWLRQLALDGRGGSDLQIPAISRGRAQTLDFSLSAHTILGDWTAGSFSMNVRLSPDASGAPAASYTCTTGTPAGGVTTVSCTVACADQSGLPSDGNADGLAVVYYELEYTVAGVDYLVSGGAIPITGAV